MGGVNWEVEGKLGGEWSQENGIEVGVGGKGDR